jgi:response regulator RpfG family c-di-GMP phosphodiesterase
MNIKNIEYENLAKILIVDDDDLIRKILSKYLRDKGYFIETADNGKMALDKLNLDSFDLVLTDLRMPLMGGRELLKAMSEQYPEIPKIVLTGHGTNEDIIIALKTGAYDFLSKPISDFTILDHSIERALEKKHLSDERKKYIDKLNNINEVISMLNKGKNTEDIFHTLNQTLRKIIPYHRLTLATVSEQDDMMVTKLVVSDKEILSSEETFPLDKQSIDHVIKNKSVLNINNLEEYMIMHPESKSTKLLIKEGMESSLVLPLIINNNVKGFLLFASEYPDAFVDDHIIFLESIVGQISFSLQRGELIHEIEQYTKNLEHLVELRSQEVLKTQKTTIFAMSKLAETRDPETGGHLERIRNYSVLLAQILKYSGKHKEITNQYLRDLYDSSILHDIGKVGITDSILLKKGNLDDEEFETMKLHTRIGFDALKSASKDLGDDSFLKMAMDVTLYHHERWDGKGYPFKLKGEEIPLSARIVAIVDMYDALTSRRPYKAADSHENALDIMKSESYKFDPELFKAFYENSDEFNKIRKQFSSD